jgi:GNAT superfamily N-acetyltransferase
VLALELACRAAPAVRPVRIRQTSLDDWLHMFNGLAPSARSQQAAHRGILQAIPGARLLISVSSSQGSVCCGMGVLENGLLGLFDIITDRRFRNEGYASSLVEHGLAWARDRGATHAYVQCEAGNAPARGMYAKFGFEESYRYWYRVPKA